MSMNFLLYIMYNKLTKYTHWCLVKCTNVFILLIDNCFQCHFKVSSFHLIAQTDEVKATATAANVVCKKDMFKI